MLERVDWIGNGRTWSQCGNATFSSLRRNVYFGVLISAVLNVSKLLDRFDCSLGNAAPATKQVAVKTSVTIHRGGGIEKKGNACQANGVGHREVNIKTLDIQSQMTYFKEVCHCFQILFYVEFIT